MKKFNVTGVCIRRKHYMVDISGKMKEIMQMVYDGCYFTINRGRQYGKTTTLFEIEDRLNDSDYICVCTSFEATDEEMFESNSAFCQGLLWRINNALKHVFPDYAKLWMDEDVTTFDKLSNLITKLCNNKKVVLIIDEVDATSNNRIFLTFLAMLRAKYLARERPGQDTFHSVVLAGVHDIKNLKLKLVNEGKAELKPGERQLNSPWNIATDFNVDMSFNPAEISNMLEEYEKDHQTGMDISAIANEIYDFTSGYPFLVSRICKYIDDYLNKNWTVAGVHEAIRIIPTERSTLFDDLVKNLAAYKNLYNLLYLIIIRGVKRKYVIYDDDVYLAVTFGYVKRIDNITAISNKIFELLLCEYFVNQDVKSKSLTPPIGLGLYHEITAGGTFNMELCLRKFAAHYKDIYAKRHISFFEEHGAIILLSFLNPLVNGNGFYHLESRLADYRRMDIVVDYGKDQFIIEAKLWSGEAGRAKAYDQLLGYMEAKNASKGYLVTFDLRRVRNKEQKIEWVQVGDKQIFDVVV